MTIYVVTFHIFDGHSGVLKRFYSEKPSASTLEASITCELLPRRPGGDAVELDFKELAEDGETHPNMWTRFYLFPLTEYEAQNDNS